MKDQYVEQLENKIHELIKIITDPNLWNFLTETERNRVAKVLEQV
jgi:hypothetical protein